MKRGKVVGIIIGIGLISIFSMVYINKKNSYVQTAVQDKDNHLTPVMVESLNQENYEEWVKYPGKLSYGKEENVMAMIDEKIVYVGFKEGDYVKEGEVILKFDSSEIDKNLNAAKEEYEKALEKSGENNQKLENLKEDKINMEKEITELESKVKTIEIELKKLEESLKLIEESFSKNEVSKEEYEQKVEEINGQVQIKTVEIKKINTEIQSKKLAIEGLNKTLEGLEKLNLGNIGIESAKKMYDQMEKMKESYIIKAPISGKITSLNGYLNEKIDNKIMPLVTISNLDTVSFEFGVDEEEKEKFSIGEKVELEVEKDGEKIKEKGTIVNIDRKPDVRTLQNKIKVEINNANQYKVDSYAEVFIDKDKSLNNNMISKNALIREEDKTFVYIVKEDIVEKREIIIGQENNHRVSVEEGLEQDELIVIKGKEFISEGKKVKIVQGDKS